MKSVLRKLAVHSAIRFGASVLGVLIAIAALAPWLGTVDPAAMDSANINTLAGTRGTFSLLDGTSLAHEKRCSPWLPRLDTTAITTGKVPMIKVGNGAPASWIAAESVR